MKVFYRGERVVLIWDGLSAHWSRAMRAWVAEQDWLTMGRLPARLPSDDRAAQRGIVYVAVQKRELAERPHGTDRLQWGDGPPYRAPVP